jgi:hypothetical protein
MQQGATPLDVVHRIQNNAQSAKEFSIQQQVQVDGVLEQVNPLEQLCLESEPYGKVTAFISDTVTPMRYREVIRAPLWLLAIIYFFMLTLVISLWSALGDNAALISLGVFTVALVRLYSVTALTVEVDEKEVRVGTAHIDLKFIGECLNLDSEAIRRVRTRDADPRAFLAIRFWADKGVQITIDDTRDSTPYWLISSNRGAELIEAIKG